MLYRYPQVEFPHKQLIEENLNWDRELPEYELIDALGDSFAYNHYFNVFIEYAIADQEDIPCRISVINQGPEPAPIQVLPHIWFRNTWSWGDTRPKPELRARGDRRFTHGCKNSLDRWNAGRRG